MPNINKHENSTGYALSFLMSIKILVFSVFSQSILGLAGQIEELGGQVWPPGLSLPTSAQSLCAALYYCNENMNIVKSEVLGFYPSQEGSPTRSSPRLFTFSHTLDLFIYLLTFQMHFIFVQYTLRTISQHLGI